MRNKKKAESDQPIKRAIKSARALADSLYNKWQYVAVVIKIDGESPDTVLAIHQKGPAKL